MAVPPFIVVRIDDVDTSLRIAHAMDTQEQFIQVHFRDYPGGMLLIPSIGEFWLVERRGHQWYLDKRLDSQEEHDAMQANLGQGDMRLMAPGSLMTLASSMYLNDRPIGTTVEDVFFTNTGFSEVVLTHFASSAESITPSLNGLVLAKTTWTYNAATKTIKFASVIGEIGSLSVTYQTWQTNNDDAATIIGSTYITAIEEFIDA